MESKDLMQIPQVLLFDCSEDVYKGLLERRYNVKKASFGKDIKVDFNSEREVRVPIFPDVPRNMHEFEIFVVDMCGIDEAIELKDIPNDYKARVTTKLQKPNDILYTSALTSKYIFRKGEKPTKGLYIVFEGDFMHSKHQLYDAVERTYSTESGYTYDFFRNICNYSIETQRRNGKRTVVLEETSLGRILAKYNDSFFYLVKFEHPIIYDEDLKTTVKRDDFVPLVLNDSEEIVSYICCSEDNIILVLPQTDLKRELLIELFEDYFPEIMPEFFPESTKLLWLSDPKYALPNTEAFEERKQAARQEYEEKAKQIEAEIKENNEEFGYLHDLLIETDNILVEAVIAWLKWLGFQNVINVDKERGTKHEDINIIENDFVIIAEAKGIGGTSTDPDCSQISKHRRRHEVANRGKGIYPVYIVNHQRYISPELRRNPPFTKDQIDYAVNDERGLVTTYQLFIWYRLINKGVFCKEEIRDVLRNSGLIPLVPLNYRFLGMIKEYLQIPRAFIIALDNVEVRIGDSLLFVKELDFQKADILSIQDEGKSVEKFSAGEAGIVVDAKIGKGFSVYLCPKTEA